MTRDSHLKQIEEIAQVIHKVTFSSIDVVEQKSTFEENARVY